MRQDMARLLASTNTSFPPKVHALLGIIAGNSRHTLPSDAFLSCSMPNRFTSRPWQRCNAMTLGAPREDLTLEATGTPLEQHFGIQPAQSENLVVSPMYK